MKITFGKYKGEEISTLPSSYLKWVLENIPNQDLTTHVRNVLLGRMVMEFTFSDETEVEYYEGMGLDPEWFKD